MKDLRQIQGGDWRADWEKLKARLAVKLEALSAEVRSYPTPIARCDDQLPKLLDRRAAVHRLLRRAGDQAVDGMTEEQGAALLAALTREAEDI